MFEFQAKIRIAGRVSYVSVQASDSAHARLLVRAQYGEQVTILQTKRCAKPRTHSISNPIIPEIPPMKSHTNAVAEFHNQVSSHVADMPRLLQCDPDHARKAAEQLRQTLTILAAMDSANSELMSRLEFALEELCEWVEAHAAADLVAAADAWGDRCYVLLGDAVATGMPVDEIFKCIART